MAWPYAQPPSPLEDRSLPHQIRLGKMTSGPLLTVSCNCLRGAYLAAKTRFETGEGRAIYRAHLAAARGPLRYEYDARPAVLMPRGI